MNDYKLYCGHNVNILSAFEGDSVDLTVTSPPYDGLRTYEGFTFDFEGVARELVRVTKPGGVIVWVVNDEVIDGSESGTSFRQALGFMELGLKLHDTMIYDKNGFRFPSPNRYHNVFEYMFVFSKGAPKTFNPIIDRVRQWEDSHKSQIRKRERNGEITFRRGYTTAKGENAKRYNIWRYAGGSAKSENDTKEHPAVFPEALARDHILSWSNPGDLVLDPFVGSGTTGKMAIANNRRFIGIDISQKYIDMAEQRIARSTWQLSMNLDEVYA